MFSLGNWITNGTSSPFYVRKELLIKKEIANASADVCGLGQFIFSINGQKVSDHVLDPGWTDYRKYIEYVRYDLTGILKPGSNCIGAEIGNGWYIMNKEHYTFSFPDFMPPNPNPYIPFGKELVFAMNLTIEYKDGTIDVIQADDTFKTKPHFCIQSNVYGSETFDGRLRMDDWNQLDFDDSDWEAARIVAKENEPQGELVKQFQPPVKAIRSYQGKFVCSVNGRDIYDFGQNMSGILHIRAKGKKGDTIRVYPAEKQGLGGDADQVMKGWVTLDTVITFILGKDDEWEDFEMKFTYFAGKVAAVEKSRSGIVLGGLTADAITSAWKTTGHFHCDDERYNQIYDMIEKTVEANMMSVHTDCPTIERFAWQEPNHLMAPSIMFMKDGKELWRKFLLDMRMQQHTADDFFYDFEGNTIPAGDGLVPSQCPCYIPNVLPVPGMGSFYDIIPWGSALILGARWHYRFYGDPAILEENYSAGMKYLRYLQTKVNADGFINHGLGDWGNPDQELARENIETAFLYADTIALAESAQILCKHEDEKELLSYAAKVRENYNKKLLVKDPEGHRFYRSFEHKDKDVMSQACEALPLYFDLVPDEYRKDVSAAFRKTLEEKGCFASGEIGLPYIIQTAKALGLNDLIASFITKEEHPSYYAFIKDGMTTLGEYWEKNPRSHCHDMMGHVIEWYYTGIAGIKPLAPGFSEVKIDPWMPESMNAFSCSYDSPNGRIEVSGIRRNGIPEYRVTLPEGIKRFY